MLKIVKWFHMLGSPVWFYRFSGAVLPWAWALFLILLGYGLYGGLITAPPDYQQGDSFRIIYIHVPAAWMSMFVYVVMAVAGAVSLIWRMKMADIVMISSAPIGAIFTFIALATGSLWGKPMWGAWWVWDARLTSELILLFLYLGVIALYQSMEDRRTAGRAVAILALVGIINIPIIHFSVEWWNTLHQGATVTAFSKPSMDTEMLVPLLVMSMAFKLFYGIALFHSVRAELIEREYNRGWVRKIAQKAEDND